MRREPPVALEKARREHPAWGCSDPGTMFGYFQIRGLNIISSGHCEDGDATNGWEHVSVSLPKRCPTWDEMCFVKSLFWDDTETVIQFHPHKSVYVNTSETCLHLWRWAAGVQPMPPLECV